jgi:hypothetical protein
MLRNHRLRTVLIASTAVLVGLLPGAASASPAERHCSVTITGQKPSGELTTTAPTCSSGPAASLAAGPASASSVIAVHYAGANFSGSTYTVNGTGCTGGYLNLPTDWVNVISSTWSSCAVSHFDLYYLAGDVETTYSPSNLLLLNDRTNSVRYS